MHGNIMAVKQENFKKFPARLITRTGMLALSVRISIKEQQVLPCQCNPWRISTLHSGARTPQLPRGNRH